MTLARSPAFRFGLLAALLAALGAWIYAPALHGTWLWDDNSELTSNLAVRDASAHSLVRIWFAPSGPDYLPLKTSVQWVEWQLWQDRSTLGYHLVSLALHLASALLLWRVLRQLGVRLAWLGAVLWVVHPLAVDSVAWLAELKNTLSLPLLLLALSAWLGYDSTGRARSFVAALLLFAASLLSKSSGVMLPVVLLLIIWWRRGRITGRELVMLVPFFTVSLVLGLATIQFQHAHAIVDATWDLPPGDLFSRTVAAGQSLAFYTAKTLLPVGLAPVYPRWPLDASVLHCWPWVLAVALVVLCWRRRATWGRHALLGFGFFALNLLPVLGFVDMAYLHIGWVADHLAYLSLVAGVGLAAAGASLLVAQVPAARRTYFTVSLAAACVALAALSRSYAAAFASPDALWSYTLAREPDSWLAHNNLGASLLHQGKWTEAEVHLQAAVRLKPAYAVGHVNLADALLHLGRTTEALAQNEEALRLDRGSVEAHYNLANLLAQSGRLPEAVDHYREALRLAPDSVDAQVNLANTLVQLNRLPEALEHYAAAVRVNPAAFDAQLSYGNVLAATGQLGLATEHFNRAVQLRPDSAEAQYSLADALAAAGHLPESLPHYEAALRVAPDNPQLRASYAEARAALARPR